MDFSKLVASDDEVPPLAYWRLDHCYEIVRELLDDPVFTWRNESAASIHEPTRDGPYAIDAWLDDNFKLAYQYMACSQITAGALAPLFETLFYRAAQRFRRTPTREDRSKEHPRWRLPDDDFWDSSKFRLSNRWWCFPWRSCMERMMGKC